jgi:serine/threonine protein kinase/tetratricopeptide (TPR) repeat protein
VATPLLPSRFVVCALLGQGGGGRVYRIRDSLRDRDLALKLVTPSENLFLRLEFDTLRHIRHENLIQVFDWGELSTGEAYYTMELIEGEDWGQRMGAPQPKDEVRRILTGLLRGLAHLHCYGEIHGDLKPGNILLGAAGVVKVTDVGMGGGSAAAERSSGTPGYAAPEIWEGARPDIRSDIYSVGVMAYEALTGNLPFGGRRIREVVAGQMEGWVPSPAAHGVSVPADLERVVMRALERAPNLRQGSGDEFMEGMGVEDRVGEIAPATFIGRDREINRILNLVRSPSPKSATLGVVVGPPGIGKSSLIAEISTRAAKHGVREVEAPVRIGLGANEAMRELVGLCLGENPSAAVRTLEEFATLLQHRLPREPLLIWSPTPVESLGNLYESYRSLARHIWASSLEDDRPAQFLILLPCESQAKALDPFEDLITLDPLSSTEVALLAHKFLGVDTLPSNFIARLEASCGGFPELAIGAILEAINRGILARRDGKWGVTRESSRDELQLSSVARHLVSGYASLPEDSKKLALQLALLPTGIQRRSIQMTGRSAGTSAALAYLEARGWIGRAHRRLVLVSQGLRRSLLESADPGAVHEAAHDLLSETTLDLSEDELATLELHCAKSPQAIDRAINAAREALLRGDVGPSIDRLIHAIEIARTSTYREGEVRATLLLAEAYHKSGDHNAAHTMLMRTRSEGEIASRLVSAHELRLEAGIVTALGNFGHARGCLLQAIAVSEREGQLRDFLLSHAELAELDWSRGGEKERVDALSRIREVLARVGCEAEYGEERAALAYGLGAALIRIGSRVEAREFLVEEFDRTTMDYWRMRIANAIATADIYLGNLEGALVWGGRALDLADRTGADAFRVRILTNRAAMYFGIGRIREASEEHQSSARIARRVGNPFEYASACVSSAIDLVWLARYEDAIRYADETLAAADRMGDLRYTGKALEVKGLASFLVGDLPDACKLTDSGRRAMETFEYVDCRPRLDWLRSRVDIRNGEIEKGIHVLQDVERSLVVTRDKEDLLGVQVELSRARFRLQPSLEHITALRKIASDADEAGILIAYLGAVLAVAEAEIEIGKPEHDLAQLLTDALGRSESAGTDEISWQIRYHLGRIEARGNNMKAARSLYSSATRGIRQIADRLSAVRRHFYLSSAPVQDALEFMSR